MVQRSAHLNHKYQLPLGMEGAGPEIVKLIKSSMYSSNLTPYNEANLDIYFSVWKVCDGCTKYNPRERFTFEVIAEKMEDLNHRAPGPAPSAPNMSEIGRNTYGNRYVNGAFSSG